jgi:phosphoribosyl 1,2-cyclic phosphate phosphodiesterase
MRLTFIGTGSTSAAPLYGCDCAICAAARNNPTLKRNPASALVEAGDTRLLIDAGLHNLGERFPAGSFNAFLITHFHADHVQGLFPIRWGIGEKIAVYGPPDTEGCADLYKNPGLLDFRTVHKFETFTIGEITITPVPLIHSKPTLGYCLEWRDTRIAYLTDTVGLPPATAEFLQQWQPTQLILDCSFPPRLEVPKGHNDVTRALESIAQVQPQQALLTHIGHELVAWLNQSYQQNHDVLPPNVSVARDGMILGA